MNNSVLSLEGGKTNGTISEMYFINRALTPTDLTPAACGQGILALWF